MSGFDLAAILLAVAAIFGYLNHRVLRLPPTSGILAVALVSSLLLVAADAALPSLHIQATVARFVSRIDFNQTLMRGMLSFLLFAGALHLDLEGLLEDRWTIGMSIAVVLIARLVSVAVPVAAMRVRGRFKRGIVPVLTWSGLRGGLSVAMALSLPPFPARGLILACTYLNNHLSGSGHANESQRRFWDESGWRAARQSCL
jgi:Na+:H+ antiporter